MTARRLPRIRESKWQSGFTWIYTWDFHPVLAPVEIPGESGQEHSGLKRMR